ncbi:hypothetical protein M885DRAFT_493677 [Pelagophyceae sp. CCMP2097]|nr:hypothetical protein M885DRAFT_493677 [Pelagophyceae sp. CCMP2097]
MEAAIAKNQLPVPPRPIKPKPAGAAVGKAPVQWDFDVVWGMMRSSRKRGYADSSHEAMRSTFVTEDRRITGATRVTNAGVAHGWGTVATRVIRSGETFVDVRAVYSPRISPELMAKKSDSYIKYQDGLFKVRFFDVFDQIRFGPFLVFEASSQGRKSA